MSKSILVIKGSARNEGYTNKLVDLALESAGDCRVTVFNAYANSFMPCTGCNYCGKNKRCVYSDLDEFFNEFAQADLIIFASPVYNGTFTSPFKSLLDRFQVFYTGFYSDGKCQQIKKHREAIFVAASGRDGVKAFGYMKDQLKCAFTILNITLKKSILCAYTDTEPTFQTALAELKKELSDEKI